MRTVLLVLLLVGCASNPNSKKPDPNWEWLWNPPCPGTRYYDPQFCKGESWQQLPNQPFEAQVRRARGEEW